MRRGAAGESAVDHRRGGLIYIGEMADNDAQRRHIELSLRRGRRTEAVRRYKLFQQRLQRNFDVEPDFTLAELVVDEHDPNRGSS